jgi:hypothetical protein
MASAVRGDHDRARRRGREVVRELVASLGSPPVVGLRVQHDQARRLLARDPRNLTRRLADLNPLVNAAVETGVRDHAVEQDLCFPFGTSVLFRSGADGRENVHGDESKPCTVRELSRRAKGIGIGGAIYEANDCSQRSPRSSVSSLVQLVRGAPLRLSVLLTN